MNGRKRKLFRLVAILQNFWNLSNTIYSTVLSVVKLKNWPDKTSWWLSLSRCIRAWSNTLDDGSKRDLSHLSFLLRVHCFHKVLSIWTELQSRYYYTKKKYKEHAAPYSIIYKFISHSLFYTFVQFPTLLCVLTLTNRFHTESKNEIGQNEKKPTNNESVF